MRASLRVAGVCLLGGLLVSACSAEDSRTSSARQSLRTECRAAQLGRACDPDGTDSNYGDCDGLCTFDSDSFGTIVCLPIASLGISNLEHQLCGTGPACSQTCNTAGECVNVPALDDTACAGANPNATCGGRCVAGACQAIALASQCALGPDATGCGFRTCSPRNAAKCINYPYPTTTDCSSGTCDGCGACLASGGTSTCVNPNHCGNSRLDPGEQCDGNNLFGETCATVTGRGTSTGTLRCSTSCTFDTGACTGAPDGGAGTGGSAGTAGTGASGGSGGQAGSSASGGTGGLIDAGVEDGSTSTGGSSGAPAGGSGGLGAGGTESSTGGSGAGTGGSGGTPAGGVGGVSEAGVAGSTAGVPHFAEGGGCDCRAARSSRPLGGQSLIAAWGLLIGAAWRRRSRHVR